MTAPWSPADLNRVRGPHQVERSALRDAVGRSGRWARSLLPALRRRYSTPSALTTKASTAGRRLRLVYFVGPSQSFAGIERVVDDLAEQMSRLFPMEFDVHVIYSTAYDEVRLVRRSYTFHELGVDQLRSLPVALRRLLRELKPDILVVPQVEATVTVWLASLGLRIPVFISHFHGNPEVEERLGTLRTKIAFFVFRKVVTPRLTGLLAVAPSLRSYVEQNVAGGTPVLFSPNPVREMSMVSGRRTAEGFSFISVGRLSHQKGQDLVVSAFARVRDRLPNATLTLVGSGELEASLRAMAGELEVAPSVEFAGYVSNPAPLMARADAFVLASRWEGFGVAIVEALSAGLPVISTDCDFGPSDLITSERVGLLVPPDRVDLLGEALVEMAGRQDRLVDQDYRKGIARRFSPAVVAREHRNVLRRLTLEAAGRFGQFEELVRAGEVGIGEVDGGRRRGQVDDIES